MSEAWGLAYYKLQALIRRLDHLQERILFYSKNPKLEKKRLRLERACSRVSERIHDCERVLQALHV